MMRFPTQAACHPCIEESAETERLLRDDPGGAYLCSDGYSKWQCHHAAGEIAMQLRVSAGAVVQRAIERAREADGDLPMRCVAYHLIGDGRVDLVASLRTPSGFVAIMQSGAAVGPRAYLYVLAMFWVALVMIGLAAAARSGASWVAIALSTPVVVLVALQYAVGGVRALVRSRPDAAPPPRLAEGADALCAGECVLVAVPAVVGDVERARQLVAMLAALAAVYPASVRFALLSDFPDSAAPEESNDDEVLDALRTSVDLSNAILRDDLGDRVFVFHRARVWSESEQVWMGWERKRGKIVELVRSLSREASSNGFSAVLGGWHEHLEARRVPLVLVLDESSWISPEDVSRLVRTARHPLNRARFDGAGRRISGYAIFQPRLEFVPAGTMAMRRVESNPAGGAPFAMRCAGRSFHARAFGHGTYRGAGALLDVDAFRRAVDGVFPDGIVLQHDFIEGLLAGVAEVGDASVVQEVPSSYLAQSRRGHRWLRGLFQLLPWALALPVGRRGRTSAMSLSGYSRWRIVELVGLELSAPATIGMLLFIWTAVPSAPLVWTLAACPTIANALIVLAIRLIASGGWHVVRPEMRDRAGRLSRNTSWALHQVFGAGFSLLTLAHEATVVLDALGKACWRLFATGRQLLEWTPRTPITTATVQPPMAYIRAFLPSTLVGCGVLILTLWTRGSVIVALPFAVLWTSAPLLVLLFDRWVLRPSRATASFSQKPNDA